MHIHLHAGPDGNLLYIYVHAADGHSLDGRHHLLGVILAEDGPGRIAYTHSLIMAAVVSEHHRDSVGRGIGYLACNLLRDCLHIPGSSGDRAPLIYVGKVIFHFHRAVELRVADIGHRKAELGCVECRGACNLGKVYIHTGSAIGTHHVKGIVLGLAAVILAAGRRVIPGVQHHTEYVGAGLYTHAFGNGDLKRLALCEVHELTGAVEETVAVPVNPYAYRATLYGRLIGEGQGLAGLDIGRHGGEVGIFVVRGLVVDASEGDAAQIGLVVEIIYRAGAAGLAGRHGLGDGSDGLDADALVAGGGVGHGQHVLALCRAVDAACEGIGMLLHGSQRQAGILGGLLPVEVECQGYVADRRGAYVLDGHHHALVGAVG